MAPGGSAQPAGVLEKILQPTTEAYPILLLAGGMARDLAGGGGRCGRTGLLEQAVVWADFFLRRGNGRLGQRVATHHRTPGRTMLGQGDQTDEMLLPGGGG